VVFSASLVNNVLESWHNWCSSRVGQQRVCPVGDFFSGLSQYCEFLLDFEADSWATEGYLVFWPVKA